MFWGQQKYIVLPFVLLIGDIFFSVWTFSSPGSEEVRCCGELEPWHQSLEYECFSSSSRSRFPRTASSSAPLIPSTCSHFTINKQLRFFVPLWFRSVSVLYLRVFFCGNMYIEVTPAHATTHLCRQICGHAWPDWWEGARRVERVF